MFVTLEFFWVASFIFLGLLRNKFPMHEFAICLAIGFLTFICLVYAQGVNIAIELAVKITFMLICCLFVLSNVKLASASLFFSYIIYFFFFQTFGIKASLLPSWLLLTIPLFLLNFKDALKNIDFKYFVLIFFISSIYFFFFNFRTQILILFLLSFLYFLPRLSKPLLHTVPILLFSFFVYFGSQFFYFFDDNIENITRSNIQRSFYNFYIFQDLSNYFFGKNITYFTQEMWYLLPDLFYVSSYNNLEIDPHNIIGFFLLYAGFPGLLLFFLIIFILTRKVDVKENKIVFVILISGLIATLSLAPFSAASRISISFIIGLLHALTSYEKEAKHNYNLF